MRHLIELCAGASLTLIEHHFASGEHAHLGNALAHVHLADDASLVHARVQDESPRATLFTRTDAVLAANARYQRVGRRTGGCLVAARIELSAWKVKARTSPPTACCSPPAAPSRYAAGIEHIARDTQCELTWRGLAAGRSRAVFHGGILIHAGADGSDANLSNKNLLLSDAAEIDSQPVLEIHADEVKAAHGRPSASSIQSPCSTCARAACRGGCTRLLTTAFCREVVNTIGAGELRDALGAALDRAHRGAGTDMNAPLDTTSAIDWARIRSDFPAAWAPGPGKPLCISIPPTPGRNRQSVIDTVDDFYRHHNANVSRACIPWAARRPTPTKPRAANSRATSTCATTNSCSPAAPPSRSTWSRIRGHCRGCRPATRSC
jgi:hypothetical protein